MARRHLVNRDPAIAEIHGQHFDAAEDEGGTGELDKRVFGLSSRAARAIEQAHILRGDLDAAVLRRPFQLQRAEGHSPAIARIGERGFHIIPERSKINRPAGEAEHQRRRQHECQQNQSAENLENHNGSGLADQ